MSINYNFRPALVRGFASDPSNLVDAARPAHDNYVSLVVSSWQSALASEATPIDAADVVANDPELYSAQIAANAENLQLGYPTEPGWTTRTGAIPEWVQAASASNSVTATPITSPNLVQSGQPVSNVSQQSLPASGPAVSLNQSALVLGQNPIGNVGLTTTPLGPPAPAATAGIGSNKPVGVGTLLLALAGVWVVFFRKK